MATTGREHPRRRSASDVASGDGRGRMDEPVKRLVLALVGAVALTAERADELADSLAERGGMSREEVRGWIDESTTRWRGDAVRVGEKAGATLHGALHELGLVTRDEWDELELRVAQLEHRLRLVETQPRPLPAPRD
jgi:polyhydroxyalkanoate synthesis regulator phasin